MIQNLATLVWFLCNIHAPPRGAHGSYKNKSVPQRIPIKITKEIQKKPGGEIICNNFWVNGTLEQTTAQRESFRARYPADVPGSFVRTSRLLSTLAGRKLHSTKCFSLHICYVRGHCKRRQHCLNNSPDGLLCNFIGPFGGNYSPESQVCDSVGPCSGHCKFQITEINSDQRRISKIICNISGD